MDIEDLLGFAKRAGFFWPAAEIYGGASGLFDYGHIGAPLKRNLENEWLRFFVERNRDYHLIEGSTLLPEKPLIASGHTARFNDVVVGCSKCKAYYRADVLLGELGIPVSEGAGPDELESAIETNRVKCPKCGAPLMAPKDFSLMIDVSLGPEKHELGYLRPETAQSTYLNFFREFNILRKRLPLGLAIVGRAYRNEISPRQGLYRMRELTQAELQIFFDPDDFKIGDSSLLERELSVVLYRDGKERKSTGKSLVDEFGIPEFYAYHLCLIDSFYRDVLHVPGEKLRFAELGGKDKAFYNKLHFDIQADIGSWNGFKEVGGLHYRGEHDLSSHAKGSQQDLSVNVNGRRITPNVLELSFGIDRNVWMLIDMFYHKGEERSVLSLPPRLAPYSVAVLPLQKEERILKYAEGLASGLRSDLHVCYDSSGSIGRRYARMDEVGTPFCVTVDFDTIEGKSQDTVTVRERDTKKQERVSASDLHDFISKKLSG